MTKPSQSKYRPEYDGKHSFDFKDPSSLYRFIGEGAKIVPARISKLSLKQQNDLARAVKKARNLALLPSGSFAFDNFSRPSIVSPKPFDI